MLPASKTTNDADEAHTSDLLMASTPHTLLNARGTVSGQLPTSWSGGVLLHQRSQHGASFLMAAPLMSGAKGTGDDVSEARTEAPSRAWTKSAKKREANSGCREGAFSVDYNRPY